MSRALALLFCLALGACATPAPPEPKIQVVEKRVPVPTPCIAADTPPPPTYPDSDQALRAATGAAFTGLLAAGRRLRIQRSAEIEPQVAACRQLPTP